MVYLTGVQEKTREGKEEKGREGTGREEKGREGKNTITKQDCNYYITKGQTIKPTKQNAFRHCGFVQKCFHGRMCYEKAKTRYEPGARPVAWQLQGSMKEMTLSNRIPNRICRF